MERIPRTKEGMERHTEKIADPVPVVPLNTARLSILFFTTFLELRL